MVNRVSVDVSGFKDLEKQLARSSVAVEAEMERALFSIAKQIEGDAKKSIQSGSKTGITYKRRGIEHQASSAGEAPASDTGQLANSINGKRTSKLSAEVRAKAKYAGWLEFGTRFIKPRPFMLPAFEKNRRFIQKRVQLALKRAFK